MTQTRRVMRLIASAVGAGGMAFGTVIATAFVNTPIPTPATKWIVLGAVVGAIGKDIQSNLSRPPEREA